MLKIRAPATIVPIFYHVDPFDLRYIDQGKGIYADAFSQHARKARYTKERLDLWKAALHKISSLSGLQVNNNKDILFLFLLDSQVLHSIYVEKSDA